MKVRLTAVGNCDHESKITAVGNCDHESKTYSSREL